MQIMELREAVEEAEDAKALNKIQAQVRRLNCILLIVRENCPVLIWKIVLVVCSCRRNCNTGPGRLTTHT